MIVRSFSDVIFVNFFFPLPGPYFLFLCMPCDFVVENWTFESNNVVCSRNQILSLARYLLVFVNLFLL